MDVAVNVNCVCVALGVMIARQPTRKEQVRISCMWDQDSGAALAARCVVDANAHRPIAQRPNETTF